MSPLLLTLTPPALARFRVTLVVLLLTFSQLLTTVARQQTAQLCPGQNTKFLPDVVFRWCHIRILSRLITKWAKGTERNIFSVYIKGGVQIIKMEI